MLATIIGRKPVFHGTFDNSIAIQFDDIVESIGVYASLVKMHHESGDRRNATQHNFIILMKLHILNWTANKCVQYYTYIWKLKEGEINYRKRRQL